MGLVAGKIDLVAARSAAVAAIDAAAEDLVALSKFIHDNPEVAMEEVQASAACAFYSNHTGSGTPPGHSWPAQLHGSRKSTGRWWYAIRASWICTWEAAVGEAKWLG